MTTIAMEEYELMKDSKYRMYVAAVDKALKSFEYTSEWADLISALGKLNKVLTLNTKFPVIPRRIKISKRLAQCMHPALPSGVHLKALETYDIIFRCMGTNRLSHELFIYSAGLFPLLGHAAMNIRPTLLTIYETHFVPLRERLRPALSGFLSGVLPGLEPGSDHFDRTNALLENVCDGVGPAWFYTCIWQCVRSNSPIRLPAISYILAHYSRKLSMEDQLYLMGNDIDVMIAGLSAAVQDVSVLVQRSALDLLMACFPMHNTQLLYADMVRLVTAALTTILRRDMSLNRRLYSWLLDTEVNTPPITQREHFEEEPQEEPKTKDITFDLLIEAIREILKQSSGETSIDIKPYRLLTSLFEKPQIGPVILDNILYEVFRALYLSCSNQQKHRKNSIRCVSFNGDVKSLKASEETALTREFLVRNCQDLIKNANLLFNTLQSYYIWSYIEKLYKEAVGNVKNCSRAAIRDVFQANDIGSGLPSVLEICLLTNFLLDIIPIETYADNTSEILPNLFNNLVDTLKNNIDVLNKNEIQHSLQLCTKILSKIQPLSIVPVKAEIEVTLEKSDGNEVKDEACVDEVEVLENKEVKVLEKSKSDSKLNEKMGKNELVVEDDSRERSNSNQMGKKKEKSSPKIDKKAKNKKSKSSSKLYELKNDEILEVETTSQSEPNSIVEQLETKNTTPKTTTKVEKKLFITCLDKYKQFYVAFLKSKIIPDINIDAYFSSFESDTDQKIRELERLLIECLERKKNTSPETPNLSIEKQLDCFSNPLELNDEFDAAMEVATNVLLEFSSFSNLLNPQETQSNLPFWLKTLIVCSCCPNTSHNAKLTAMNALLDIFSLAKSQKCNKTTSSNVNVVMGILESEHVSYIEDKTIVVEVMARILWDLLGKINNQKQLMLCVSLLYQIHNVFDLKMFIEDVIGRYLTCEASSVEFFKRFSVLWHLGRDLNIKLPAHQNSVRNFDRTLLKILDNLQTTTNPNMKLLAETFLTHALLRNDTSRILNPILNKLLAPHTARISIRHVNIHDTDSQTEFNSQETNGRIEEDKAKKVYAVSNVNGNIMYHVAENNPSPRQNKKKWFLFSKAGKKYTQVVNMTTSLTENLHVITRRNRDYKNVTPDELRASSASSSSSGNNTNGASNVKLFVNPLSSREVYPNGLDGSYAKIGSRSTSSESLSDLSSGGSPHLGKSQPCDSGFESLVQGKSYSDGLKLTEAVKKSILERLEPISDGVKDRDVEDGSGRFFKSKSFEDKSVYLDKNQDLENGALVHSWSYCISDSDNMNAELEISTSAEEFFKGSDTAIVSEVLNEIINQVCEISDGKSITRPVDLELKPKISDHKNFSLYPIHYHLCLYYEVFDSNQVLYALKTLKNCIQANPQLFIRCLATSGLKDMKSNEILQLLARHRKSILGSGFSGEVSQENVNFYRGYTFLDVIISVCLNYARSFYPSLDDPNLTAEEMENNLKIQIFSLEILDVVIRNLLTLVKENSKGFSSYIADMLVKCKLQKVLLHCLLTSVRNFDEDLSFAEEILIFNNFKLQDTNNHNKVGEHVEAFQTQLLRLIHSLIILEYNVFPNFDQNSSQLTATTPSSGEHMSYAPTTLIPKQQMFLSAIMSALRHTNMKSLHEKWCNMVTLCLPYFSENLKQIALSVIHQICNNIERIAANYKNTDLEGDLCSDYAVTQLESLTILCHYCLLDSSQTVNQTNVPNSTTNNNTGGDILNNLVAAFFSPMANDTQNNNKHNSDYYQNARQSILSHMPRIISSVAKLWQTVVGLEGEYNGVYGNSRVVRQQLLEFLSPISVHHSGNFLAAVAVAWYERKSIFAGVKTVLPEPNASQMNLVYLISAIRVIPLDNLVQTVTAVIKNPPHIEGLSKEICLDVCVLELFYCYMRNASSTQLSEAWGSLLTLVREGCVLSAPAQFLLAALLHELMIKCCPLEERKDQKDLQDVTAKLIECVSQVCGSCLEQTTWLRRNLAVKEQEEDGAPLQVVSGSTETVNGSKYSVQAQLVLSEILAPVLDICFGSSEKDKVNTVLTSLMYNIVPYLRTHTFRNMASFQACSKLLSSLSSYQYTRKAWKKDVYDLLLDNAFFQMDLTCLKYWKVTVDNLMTHDNTTFRDLMSRVSMTQSGSLSLFSSREQEYEQRAQLLKRLAFVIFCSEIDQYAKSMPDIQEQLTSSLRLNVPGVQAQVFLCFRVLLLRMTHMHITSLWPIIINEMLQVFLQIEQELSTDSEEFSSHIKLLSSLDASWATNSNNGLHALGHPHWLRLQLATAKLLDLALLLPATTLPQFQMYRWAFVGDTSNPTNNTSTQINNPCHEPPCFVPHVVRIANLMDQKFADAPMETLPTKQNELLLTVSHIGQLRDLHGFFKTLSLCSNRHRTECNGAVHSEHTLTLTHDRQVDKKLSGILERLDRVIEADFLDKINK